MDPIQINLSAPIYGKQGTGVGPSQPDESVEEPSGFLAALTSAFKRKLAKSGPQGDAMKAMFGNQQYEFVGEMPVGYTHARRTRDDGRRDIRIYGHPSGRFYDSANKFLPHVVAMLVLSDRCWCDLCKAGPSSS
ncbi:hypothetical protein E4T50_10406 [Aureobasidium sp. EXF-12298]|nr:hypothetical protein E4T50_10406 [Aureobasidium sp. EXF-12298]